MESKLIDLFTQLFLKPPEIFSSAPGRINVIGEHTDYNNGYVLPAAINLRNVFLARRRNDDEVHVWAENFKQKEAFRLSNIQYSEQNKWANYVKGIFWVLKEEGFQLGGVNTLIWGNVPLESGLSSSAALEISIIKGLTELFQVNLPPEKLALLGQKAENNFVGVKCGLMDQFIAVFGRKGSALFLDCETLDYDYFPLNLEKAGLGILVYDTRVKRKLASSEYNRRRSESADALDVLKKRGAATYKDANLRMLEKVKKEMTEVSFRRAKHVISENERVKQTVKALGKDDFATVGKLLFSSHESLRDNYEVSCPELDFIYESGKKFPGCLGARLVGAGFGGSGIVLLEKSKIKEFEERALAGTKKRGFPEPAFHEISVGEAAYAYWLEEPSSKSKK